MTRCRLPLMPFILSLALAPLMCSATQAPVRDTALEATFWESVKKDGDASGFKAYLEQYPEGVFAPLALAQLRELVWAPIENSTEPSVFEKYLVNDPNGHFAELARAALRRCIEEADKDMLEDYLARYPRGAAADMSRERAATLVWPTVENSLRMSDFDGFLRRYPNTPEASLVPSAKAALARLAASVEAQFSTFSSESDGIWVGRDCQDCPEMVVVPAGSYQMGYEGQKHQVTIGRPFAVGKHEVTFAQWDACARGGGCPRGENFAKDRGWGRGQRPVIHVSWNDAQRYVQWLSGETKKPYRMLSESEWEYAARAGTETAYSWGDQVGVGRANCAGCGSQWDNRQTAPVGSFAANAWGLHDMHGNVWEWVQDCYNHSYAGSPRDGSAWLSGNCSERVLRGGSWNFSPAVIRAAIRSGVTTSFRRNNNFGFRVARTLTP